ncbi:MAG: tetraacyldisaccharide 4'-kinase [Planctomycetota bacterium]|nr:MAG: tetraacyldisaccharide 4'-kinase [Planctomycetota bacterium]
MSPTSQRDANSANVVTWMDIMSGQRRGVVASACRVGLSVLSSGYAAVTGVRNLAFDHGWRESTRVAAKVISVGNLTAGGTGKTPTVAWVVRTLQELGASPAIISRGYGGQGGVNDEKLVLDQLVPGVPHLLNPKRVLAAQELMNRPEAERPRTLVLDDAFQHRQIARDFDLILIDCLNPWGFGHLLPRGLLREPLRSLSRASCVLMTRCDQVDEEVRQTILSTIRRWTTVPILMSSFQPTRLINSRGEVRPIETLRQEHVAAFCGIGNPMGFRRTLTSCGVSIPDVHFRVYPDHHAYQTEDLHEIGDWARSMQVECLVSTQKDLVKIPRTTLNDIPLWAVEISLKFDDPESESQLVEMLKAVVR